MGTTTERWLCWEAASHLQHQQHGKLGWHSLLPLHIIPCSHGLGTLAIPWAFFWTIRSPLTALAANGSAVDGPRAPAPDLNQPHTKSCWARVEWSVKDTQNPLGITLRVSDTLGAGSLKKVWMAHLTLVPVGTSFQLSGTTPVSISIFSLPGHRPSHCACAMHHAALCSGLHPVACWILGGASAN